MLSLEDLTGFLLLIIIVVGLVVLILRRSALKKPKSRRKPPFTGPPPKAKKRAGGFESIQTHDEDESAGPPADLESNSDGENTIPDDIASEVDTLEAHSITVKKMRPSRGMGLAKRAQMHADISSSGSDEEDNESQVSALPLHQAVRGGASVVSYVTGSIASLIFPDKRESRRAHDADDDAATAVTMGPIQGSHARMATEAHRRRWTAGLCAVSEDGHLLRLNARMLIEPGAPSEASAVASDAVSRAQEAASTSASTADGTGTGLPERKLISLPEVMLALRGEMTASLDSLRGALVAALLADQPTLEGCFTAILLTYACMLTATS